MLIASSKQMDMRRLTDLKMDSTTNSKGSSSILDSEKQASHGDAKLHLPMKANKAAALKV